MTPTTGPTAGRSVPGWIRRVPTVAGSAAVVVGVVVLTGWAYDIDRLRTVTDDAVSVKVNTALLLLGLGAAELLLDRRRRRPAIVVLGIVLAVTLAVTLEWVTGVDLGIDELLVNDPDADTHPGRPGPPTLVGIGCLATALMLLAWAGRRRAVAAQLLTLTAFTLAVAWTAGYLYGAPKLYAPGDDITGTAVLTALTVMLLAVGALALRPDVGLMGPVCADTASGRQARLLLAASVVVPLVVGWLRLQGELQGWYSTRTGLALYATATVALFGLLVQVAAYSLAAAEERRRAADDALAETRRTQQELIDRAPAVICAKDLAGRFVLANQALADVYGLASPSELIGRRDSDFTDEASAEAFRAADRDVLAAGQPLELEERMPMPDGRVRVFDSVKFPLLDDQGEPVAIGLISSEVTARKEAEHEAERLRERLRQADRMQSLGQLAGGVAHDFNNLLGVILNYAALLQADLPPATPESRAEGDTTQDDLAAIVGAAERAAALSRQLLTFARHDSAGLGVIDVNALVSDLGALLRRTFPENVRLDITLDREAPAVRADTSRLEQLVMNLAVNARDAMPDGGRLVVETHRVVIRTDGEAEEGAGSSRGPVTLPPGHYLQLAVTDTGVGMTPEVRDRAFEPFFTTKARGSGTGLGLATAYGIANQLGGAISLYSEPGHGTTVRLHLPAAEEPAFAAAPTEPPVADAEQATATVLLVEDEQMLRASVRRVLDRAGYRVLEASDAESAMALLADGVTPDLLLTDVILPGRSGPQLAGELRQRWPGLPVLFASGYTEHALDGSGLVDQPFHLIEKPFALDTLLTRVRDMLASEPA
ncbi:MAG TPA: ATP-binding protein [Actinomycetes bacterium]|nr:ATP-binding protein [Actinomycetes bacterium]